MVDPITVATAVGTGLKLLDKFVALVRRWKTKDEKVTPFRARAEREGDTIQIKDKTGYVSEKVFLRKPQLDEWEWEEPRYNALYRRVKINWKLFNELFAREAGASHQEAARITIDMERTKEDLCKDFKEMVSIYQRVLGINLPDHYQLYDICR